MLVMDESDPPSTSPGLAEMDWMVGQMLNVPVTLMLPVFAG